MEFLPSIGEAFGLYVKMLLGFGLIFQMPMVVFFLARMGVVTAGFLLRHTKYAVSSSSSWPPSSAPEPTSCRSA